MKNKDKKIFNLVDKICELEGFIEYLEDKLTKPYASFTRKQDQSDLYEARLKLSKFKALLNLKSMEETNVKVN